MTDQYSFCESVHATSRSPWCIRVLTKQGQKCGGGVDTPSLCGRVQPKKGWDLSVHFCVNHPSACPRCVQAYRAHTVTST